MSEQKEHNPKSLFIHGPIPPAKVMHWLEHHQSMKKDGAHDLFIGQVRADEVEGKAVRYIEYTAYEEMADQVYQKISNDVISKYKVSCVHTLHSLGKVESGQWSLAVLVSSPHREACFAACREMVERIKSEIPVWGKEVFEDHTTAWKVNTKENEVHHD